MYRVKFVVKDSFFSEYGEEQEEIVTKEKLIEMLNNSKIFVLSCFFA